MTFKLVKLKVYSVPHRLKKRRKEKLANLPIKIAESLKMMVSNGRFSLNK